MENGNPSFGSRYSAILYEFLTENDGAATGTVAVWDGDLRDLMDMKDGAYVRPNGYFDRFQFEKNTVNVAVQEINQMGLSIQNLRYEKLKQGKRVQKYVFHFDPIEPEKTGFIGRIMARFHH